MHIHVICPDGEAKFWLEPAITLAHTYRLTDQQVRVAQQIVEAHAGEIQAAWRKYFPG